MIKRTLVERICPNCKKKEKIRKDGVGIYCRPCRARINQKLKKPKDMINKRFGKLLVLSLAYIKKHAFWNCLCDCGQECIVAGAKMRFGQTKSCGCLANSRKGKSTSPSFRSWKAMLQRCYDKSVAHYARYGAKGITVCKRWIESFEAFIEDMGERPEKLTFELAKMAKHGHKHMHKEHKAK